MPVFFSWLDRDRVTRVHVVRRLAPYLHAHAAGNDEQPLRTGMSVPVRARTGIELDVMHYDRHTFMFVVGREPPPERVT